MNQWHSTWLSEGPCHLNRHRVRSTTWQQPCTNTRKVEQMGPCPTERFERESRHSKPNPPWWNTGKVCPWSWTGQTLDSEYWNGLPFTDVLNPSTTWRCQRFCDRNFLEDIIMQWAPFAEKESLKTPLTSLSNLRVTANDTKRVRWDKCSEEQRMRPKTLNSQIHSTNESHLINKIVSHISHIKVRLVERSNILNWYPCSETSVVIDGWFSRKRALSRRQTRK